MSDETFSKFCLCLPTFNEEDHVSQVINNIRNYYDGEIIVADGFSTDNTISEAQKLGVSVILRDKPGKGSALRKALEYAENQKKEYLIYMDCDETYAAQDIPLVATAIKDADLVIGQRRMQVIGSRTRKVGNYVATGLINLFFGGKIEDSISGFKCLRVSQFRPYLNENGFVADALICVIALHRRLRICQVVVGYRPRRENSKMSFAIGLIELAKLLGHIIRIKVRS